MNLKGNLTSKGLQGSIGKSRMQGILGTNPAAIPITVDNALSLSSTNPVQNKVITAAITNRLWSDEVKTALLQIAQKVAYIDADGQDYYDALYDALYPPVGLDSISAVFDAGGATIYTTDTLADLKQYLTVTAYYTDGTSDVLESTEYTLTGTLTAGTSTITVSYGGKTTTFNVTVVELAVASISAVFTQGQNVVYTNDSLDSLRQYLVVTATYSDSTTGEILDYELSGTLQEGTATITASYAGKTDTFTVACTVNGWLYHFEQSLASSGSEDFGFLGSCSYDTGHDGNGYSMYNDTEAAYATGITAPDLSGDFTVSFWAKTLVAKNGQGFSAYTGGSAGSTLSSLGTASLVKSGWSVTSENVNHSNKGCRIASWGSSKLGTRLVNSATTAGRNYECTPPSSFDSTTWHHYAITRKDGMVRFFVDGDVIFTVSTSATLLFPTQCSLGGYYDTSNVIQTPTGNKSWYDDLFVAEYCKWDDTFDPATIAY